MSTKEDLGRFHGSLVERFSLALTIACILYWAGIILYAITFALPRAKFGVAFLGGSLVIYMGFEAYDSLQEKKWFDTAMLAIMTVIVIASTVYIYNEFHALYYTRIGYKTDMDYLFGTAIFLVLTYLTYRSFGLPFVGVIVAALIYAYWGPYFPGLFAHSGMGAQRLMMRLVLDIDGIYGNLNRLMATWIALFLLYSGLMQGYGAFDLILRAAVRTAKYVKSGVAQSAVIGSIIVGSISGSAAANTGITGSMTIPLMKESGMKSESAGATEAVASAGGQIMPPIMGAAAFLMASLLNRPFSEILVAAVVPALIFYTSVVVAVHFTASRELGDVDPTELTGQSKPLKEVVIQGLRFAIPFLLLIYFLGIQQYTILTSALYTVTATLVTGIGFPMIRDLSMDQLTDTLVGTIRGFRQGAKATVPIAVVIAAINAIVDVLMTTGMPSTLSLAILDLSGGIMIVAVILSMIICIILGLGMPTVAAYLLVALLVAPTLTGEYGVPQLAAHYFVFYSAILSALTPPIAVGVVIASGIAEASFWKTAEKALRLSAPLFVLPFMFVYHPEIVSSTVDVETIFSGSIGLIGAFWIVYALNNPLVEIERRTIVVVLKVGYFVLGVGGMMLPGANMRIGCIVAAFILYVFQAIHLGTLPTPIQRARN